MLGAGQSVAAGLPGDTWKGDLQCKPPIEVVGCFGASANPIIKSAAASTNIHQLTVSRDCACLPVSIAKLPVSLASLMTAVSVLVLEERRRPVVSGCVSTSVAAGTAAAGTTAAGSATSADPPAATCNNQDPVRPSQTQL